MCRYTNDVFPSVIIDYFDFVRPEAVADKTEAVLIVDPDAVLTVSVA